MRLARILLWSTAVLAASVLAVCVLAALFFPWDSFEERLKEALNARLHPLRIDYAKLHPFFRDGPGVTIDELRVFASGTRAGHDAFLSVGRLTVRPSLESLAGREIAAHFIVESPVFRSDRAEGDVPAPAGIVGALAQGFGARGDGQTGASSAPRPETLSRLVPLPAGFELTRASLEIRDGLLDAAPSSAMSGMRASLRVEQDLSFEAELTRGALRWHGNDKGPVRLSSMVGAEIRGRAVSADRSRVEGTLRLEETVLEWRERTATLPEPVKLTLRLEGTPDRGLTASGIQLTGPGLDIGMAGSMRMKEDGPGEIKIRDLRATVENWQPLCALAFPQTALSGTLSLVAARLEVEPGRLAAPAFREGSVRPAGPAGLLCEGLDLRFTEGRLSRTDLGGTSVSLDGLEMRLEQQDRGWAAAMDLAELHANRGEAFRFSGPATIKADWSEEGSAATAILAVDLTRGRLVCSNLLFDKPPDVSMQLGVNAAIRPDEIRVARASLKIGDTEWHIEGSVTEPTEPFLSARLAPNTISLAALAEVLPAARQHEVDGRLEIKELSLTARLREIKESARLRARLAGKDIRLGKASIKGAYAQAAYGEQFLTVSPVVIQPTTGMIEAALSADLSRTFLDAGLHTYYGTLRADHVDINDLIGMAAPNLAGKARGSADLNLAFRGSAFSRPGAAAGLEARGRIRLNGVALEEQGDPDTDSREGLSERLAHVLEGIDVEETVPREEDMIDPEQERLLAENRAAGWFAMQEGRIHTDNLVAIYEGRLIAIQGSVDLAGRLQVEKGKLFNGGRMVPFRLDCVLGEEGCRPGPDPEEAGKSAAAELAARLHLLSEAAQGVYGDLHF